MARERAANAILTPLSATEEAKIKRQIQNDKRISSGQLTEDEINNLPEYQQVWHRNYVNGIPKRVVLAKDIADYLAGPGLVVIR